MVKDYREPTKVPCNDCPFRRKAMPGWLGSGSPESFIDCINRDDILPCHQTIDYGDPLWKEKWITQATGNACAGALIMTANMCKRPRDPAFPTMEPDEEAVFATPMEFVRYHRDAPVHSWDDKDQQPQVRELHKVFEAAAKREGKPFKKHRRPRGV